MGCFRGWYPARKKLLQSIYFYMYTLFVCSCLKPQTQKRALQPLLLWHTIIGPLLDDGLKRGTPKALKGLPLSLLFCLCVCVCVCLLTSYRSQFSTQQPNFLKICSLGLWEEMFFSV